MHDQRENHTAHHALSEQVDARDGTTNVEWVLNAWIDKGAAPSKLTLGLAAYGRHFSLLNQSEQYYGAPCQKQDNGYYAGRPGLTGEFRLAYYEICEKINEQGWKREWLSESDVYARGEGEWVGYDDTQSIRTKVNQAHAAGVAGLTWRLLDLDDFRGDFCGQGRFPLLTASRDALLGTVSKLII